MKLAGPQVAGRRGAVAHFGSFQISLLDPERDENCAAVTGGQAQQHWKD
jgi:hypothetical protein